MRASALTCNGGMLGRLQFDMENEGGQEAPLLIFRGFSRFGRNRPIQAGLRSKFLSGTHATPTGRAAKASLREGSDLPT